MSKDVFVLMINFYEWQLRVYNYAFQKINHGSESHQSQSKTCPSIGGDKVDRCCFIYQITLLFRCHIKFSSECSRYLYRAIPASGINGVFYIVILGLFLGIENLDSLRFA